MVVARQATPPPMSHQSPMAPGATPAAPPFRPRALDLAAVLALFLATRLLLLTAFPYFNDEANSVEWARRIGEDWAQFKWISLDNVFGDWKPPLTYWLASVPLRHLADPLLAVRLASVAVSTVGVLSCYGLAGLALGSRRAALAAALIWTLDPLTLFYDREFVAETFVYSFGAAAWLFTWLAVTRRAAWALPAAAAAALGVLSKQSALLHAYGLVVLMLHHLRRRPPGEAGPWLRVDWRRLWIVPAVILGAVAVERLVIPAGLFRDFEGFNRKFLFTVPELLRLQGAAWGANAARIADLFRCAYGPAAALLLARFAWRCAARRAPLDLAVLALLLGHAALLVLAFKYFNEYVFHTSAVLALTAALTIGALDLGDRLAAAPWGWARRPAARWAGVALLCLAWGAHLPLYFASPERYLRTFGTAWARENYLLGWPSGFGTERAVELLAQEPPRVLLLDPGWGNPAGAIMAYLPERYPRHEVVLLDHDLLPGLETADPSTLVAVFRLFPGRGRGAPPGQLPIDQALMKHPLCRRPIILSPADAMPLVYCRF